MLFLCCRLCGFSWCSRLWIVTSLLSALVDVADFTAADLVLVVCFVLGTCVDVIVGFVLDNEVLVVETCECVVFVMFFSVY